MTVMQCLKYYLFFTDFTKSPKFQSMVILHDKIDNLRKKIAIIGEFEQKVLILLLANK